MNTFENIHLFLCFLFLGLLLILLTIRSLSEQQSKPLIFCQILLLVALALTTRHPLFCLTAYTCKTGNRNLFSIFFPSLLYGGVQALVRETTFPELLFAMLLLLSASLCLRGLEALAGNYFAVKKTKCPNSPHYCGQRNV